MKPASSNIDIVIVFFILFSPFVIELIETYC